MAVSLIGMTGSARSKKFHHRGENETQVLYRTRAAVCQPVADRTRQVTDVIRFVCAL
jgi:hypothetical protein